MTRFVSWLYRGDYSECLYSGHVELYAFACKYATEDLKPVVERNFHKGLREFGPTTATIETAIDDIERMSRSHGEEMLGLRKIAIEAACENATALMKKDEFRELIGKGGPLVVDLVEELVTRLTPERQILFDRVAAALGSSSVRSPEIGS